MHLFKLSLTAFSVAALFTQSGCGPGSNSPEGLLQQQVSLFNEMADAIEAGKTDSIESLRKQQQELGEKLAVAKPDPSEMERLKKKYEKPLQEAMQRVITATAKQAGNLGGISGMPFPDIKMPMPKAP